MMFDPRDLSWVDFEVASRLDLKATGALRYATDVSTRAIILAYAIGNGPELAWHADGAILNWGHAPDDLRAAFDRGATFAIWNASFDSPIWNYATINFPYLAPERVIDVMIQAGVSNLPTDLESASRALGGEGKQKDGKKLIQLFCVEGADPREYPEEWQLFLKYARRDVGEMRDVYRRTRPLPLEEWRSTGPSSASIGEAWQSTCPSCVALLPWQPRTASPLAVGWPNSPTGPSPGSRRRKDRRLAPRPASRRGDARGADRRRLRGR